MGWAGLQGRQPLAPISRCVFLAVRPMLQTALLSLPETRWRSCSRLKTVVSTRSSLLLPTLVVWLTLSNPRQGH